MTDLVPAYAGGPAGDGATVRSRASYKGSLSTW